MAAVAGGSIIERSPLLSPKGLPHAIALCIIIKFDATQGYRYSELLHKKKRRPHLDYSMFLFTG